MTTLIIVITLLISVCLIANYTLKHEHEIVEKADKSNFYHFLAKLTSSSYTGYYPNEDEVKSMKEFVKKPSEYDLHPIGSYIKMRDELTGILKTAGNFHNYKLNFNLGEVGTGLAVMAVFLIVVTLGVMYS